MHEDRKILAELEKLNETTARILKILSVPKSLRITFEVGDEDMAKAAKSASIDFQLQDNGSANATLTAQDAAGLDTTLPAGTSVPVWTPSDTTVLAVVAAADGMSAVVTPATPPKLATGVTISVSAILPDGTTISGVSDGIDVVSGGPKGFKISGV
jgi:hypothetical protein